MTGRLYTRGGCCLLRIFFIRYRTVSADSHLVVVAGRRLAMTFDVDTMASLCTTTDRHTHFMPSHIDIDIRVSCPFTSESFALRRDVVMVGPLDMHCRGGSTGRFDLGFILPHSLFQDCLCSSYTNIYVRCITDYKEPSKQ